MRVRPEYIPALQYHRQSGQARVKLNGKDHLLGPIDDPATRIRYDELIRSWLAGGRALPEAGPRSVRELGERFLAFARLNYTKGGKPTKTVHRIERSFVLLDLAELASVAPAAFTQADLRAFRKYLAEDPKGRYSRSTINDYSGAITLAFAWAAEHDLFESAPLVLARLRLVRAIRKGRALDEQTPPPREGVPVGPVPMDAYALARAKMLPEVAAMVEIQRLTGMRPIEVVSMRAGDLGKSTNPKVLSYVVPALGNKLEHQGRRRIVAIGPDARELLDPMLAGLKPTDYVFSPRRAVAAHHARKRASAKRPRPGAPTFRVRGAGEQYTTDSYRRAIWRACERAGLPRERWWSPNQLRHSHASLLGVEEPISVVQSVLGHSSPTTTSRYITVPAAEAVRVAAKRRKKPKA